MVFARLATLIFNFLGPILLCLSFNRLKAIPGPQTIDRYFDEELP